MVSERLSAEDREALRVACGFMRNRNVETVAEHILAAHLADVEARLAAVEALAEFGPFLTRWIDGSRLIDRDDLHRALYPDPSNPTIDKSAEHI